MAKPPEFIILWIEHILFTVGLMGGYSTVEYQNNPCMIRSEFIVTKLSPGSNQR
jgi:hypothetical protein